MASSTTLIAIVGQTASGKSSLALRLAERYDGEIIAADSRTIYKGMDIGTAKPSAAEREFIPHHLLDVVAPDQIFTAADFQAQAKKAIAEVQHRGHLPIVVGGTGLYVDSLLYDFTFRPVDQAARATFEKLSVSELQERIEAAGFELPKNDQNPRHLIRVLESGGQANQRQVLSPNTLLLGLVIDQDELRQRIEERVDQMLATGLADEVRALAAQYSWDVPGMQAIGYQEFQPYVAGTQSLQQTRDKIVQHTWQYARRQRTWFKRNPDIQWCDSIEQAETVAEAFLTTKGR